MSFSETLSIALQKSKNRDFVISVIQVCFNVSYSVNTSRILFCGYKPRSGSCGHGSHNTGHRMGFARRGDEGQATV